MYIRRKNVLDMFEKMVIAHEDLLCNIINFLCANKYLEMKNNCHLWINANGIWYSF